jgi:hypothetical protein
MASNGRAHPSLPTLADHDRARRGIDAGGLSAARFEPRSGAHCRMKSISCSSHGVFTLSHYDPQEVQVQKEDHRTMDTNRITVENAICQHLEEQGSSTMEELVRSLSRFTLNQVFFAIDRLSREGKVSLRHPTRFAYLVSAPGAGARTLVNPTADR